MIDVNVYLSRWPFRRLPLDETARLAARLRKSNVAKAWAGSFDGLLHRDVAAVNARLVSECRGAGGGILEPIGTINPTLPDWEEDLRRCHEMQRMIGVRLHPNYHGYKLDDERCGRLLADAAARGLVVQIALSMEDERTQHPLLRVPHVDAAPLVEWLTKLPHLRVVLINVFRSLRVEQVDKLAATGRAWFDIAMLEGVAGVDKLVRQVGPRRVVFGSYAPFFVYDAAELKLRESALAGAVDEAIRSGNADQIIGSAAGLPEKR